MRLSLRRAALALCLAGAATTLSGCGNSCKNASDCPSGNLCVQPGTCAQACGQVWQQCPSGTLCESVLSACSGSDCTATVNQVCQPADGGP
jgi:hypothetical protein